MTPYTLVTHADFPQDIFEIRYNLTRYVSPQRADEIISEIEADIISLAELPHIGSLREGPIAGLRAIPAGEKAVVTFVVNDQRREVFVLSITYGGADWMSRIETRLNP